ncbi:MAG: hypothetical protein V4494_05050 [Chlamydiota bacterium]
MITNEIINHIAQGNDIIINNLGEVSKATFIDKIINTFTRCVNSKEAIKKALETLALHSSNELPYEDLCINLIALQALSGKAHKINDYLTNNTLAWQIEDIRDTLKQPNYQKIRKVKEDLKKEQHVRIQRNLMFARIS